MILGLLLGKKYTRKQVTGVLLLTTGIFVAMLDGFKKAAEKNNNDADTKQVQDPEHKDGSRYIIGMFILLACSIIGSLQGLAAENLYQAYGKRWREWLFYSHALALPLFLPAIKDISREFMTLARAEPRLYLDMGGYNLSISFGMGYLILNAFTQYFCVRGVNQLAGTVSALAVTVALTVRKCVSMILSIYIFGNPITQSLILGTCLVFTGASLYASK